MYLLFEKIRGARYSEYGDRAVLSWETHRVVFSKVIKVFEEPSASIFHPEHGETFSSEALKTGVLDGNASKGEVKLPVLQLSLPSRN
jgi:hypothetical protein